jgi:hypothetical protein
MISGHIREIVVLAVLSILTILVFPAEQGPYSVVHGPATAFQAARAAARLRIAIVQGATTFQENRRMPLLAVLFWMALPNTPYQPAGLSAYDTILRC